MNGRTETGEAAPWVAVVVEVPAPRADELAGWLGLDSLGVEVCAAEAAERRRLRIYVPAARAAEAMRHVRDVLARAGLSVPPTGPGLEPVENGRWVERYQRALRPFPLGERFLVVPGEAAGRDPGRRTIRLVPGRAFGTGEHPTTRLCVTALEREVRSESDWVDVGTGSGILAVVAVHCGAARVTAIDIDPEAIEVAREVVAANGVAERVHLIAAGIRRLRHRSDGAVVNVAASYFAGHAGDLARVVVEGGTLIASGFRPLDRPEVETALAGAGFRTVSTRDDGEWSVVVARLGAEG